MQIDILNLDTTVEKLFGNLGLEVSKQAIRTNEEREWFCIRRYVEARLANGFLFEPGSLIKSESPDFIFTGLSEFTTGIEVAEGTNRDSQIRIRVDDERDEETFLTDEFDIPGDPALEWANVVGNQIRKKDKKIRGSNWKNLDSQEILIYPNLYRTLFDDQRALNLLRLYIRHFRICPVDINGSAIKIHILFGHRLLFDFLGEAESLPIEF